MKESRDGWGESGRLEGLRWGDSVMGKQGGGGAGGGHTAKAEGKWLILFPEMDRGSLGIFGFDGVIETEGKS